MTVRGVMARRLLTVLVGAMHSSHLGSRLLLAACHDHASCSNQNLAVKSPAACWRCVLTSGSCSPETSLFWFKAA